MHLTPAGMTRIIAAYSAAAEELHCRDASTKIDSAAMVDAIIDAYVSGRTKKRDLVVAALSTFQSGRNADNGNVEGWSGDASREHERAAGRRR
jgi:hypothetical protein